MRRGVPVWGWSLLVLAMISLFASTRFTNSLTSAAPGAAAIESPTVGTETEAVPTEVPVPSATATQQVEQSPTLVAAAEAATPSPTEPAPPTVAPTKEPTSREPRAGMRVGLQAGHWLTSELPDELSSLRGATGAMGAGWREVDVNLDIAQRTARLLEAGGFKVDILPATVPVGYKADVFVALHCDGNNSATPRGFKVARSSSSAIPGKDDVLVDTIHRNYASTTGLPNDDKNVTNNMRYYYALAGNRIKHSVAPTTPAAILEMGYLSNGSDRKLLMGSPDLVAKAVAAALTEFLGR